MAAPIQSARLIDGTDEGPLRAVALIRRGYVPGELMPQDAVTPDRPVVTIVSPAGSSLGPTEAFVFDVTCPETIELQRFNLRTGGTGTAWEVQYRDGEVSPGAVVTRDAITDGYRFTVRPASRWAGRSVEFEPTFGTATALAATNT